MKFKTLIKQTSISIAFLVALTLNADESRPPETMEIIFNEITISAIVEDVVPYRLLQQKDPKGFTIQTDDGTIWRVTDSSSAKTVALYWQITDVLVLHPVFFQRWYGARFYLYNQRTEQAISVELSHGPISGGQMTNHISSIDYSTGYIEITNGSGLKTGWKLNSSDKNTYKYWKVGQAIIMGSNQDCYAGWFSSHDYILINVNLNNVATADLLIL